VSDGVGYQILEGLSNAVGINASAELLGRADLHVRFRGPKARGSVVDEGSQVGLADHQGEQPVLQPGDVQQIRDDRLQA
jgi:hypothetical protein